MKPYPLVALNHLTVPLFMMVPPKNNMMIRGETKKSHIFVNQLTPNDLQKYVNQKLTSNT